MFVNSLIIAQRANIRADSSFGYFLLLKHSALTPFDLIIFHCVTHKSWLMQHSG